jgi:hypothetical protein
MANGWAVTPWSRNLLDKDYFELLTQRRGTQDCSSASLAIHGQSA